MSGKRRFFEKNLARLPSSFKDLNGREVYIKDGSTEK
jgi:hypothetical protein|nr:MAG TPA: hypothetical protein [Caudoviricetes sp.]